MKNGQYLLLLFFRICTCQDSCHLNKHIAYIPKTVFFKSHKHLTKLGSCYFNIKSTVMILVMSLSSFIARLSILIILILTSKLVVRTF